MVVVDCCPTVEKAETPPLPPHARASNANPSFILLYIVQLFLSCVVQYRYRDCKNSRVLDNDYLLPQLPVAPVAAIGMFGPGRRRWMPGC